MNPTIAFAPAVVTNTWTDHWVTHTRTYARTHTQTDRQKNVRIQTHTQTRKAHGHIRTHINAQTHVYVQTHTHTLPHTHRVRVCPHTRLPQVRGLLGNKPTAEGKRSCDKLFTRRPTSYFSTVNHRETSGCWSVVSDTGYRCKQEFL